MKQVMSASRFLLIGGVVLFASTLGAYVGTLWCDFVEFDDGIYVIYNPYTALGLSPAGFRYAWTTFDSNNWIPVTWLSLQLDSTLFGMRPIGFHVTNVVLHGTNVVLLFAWLVRVTGSRWRSLTVAGLFALHPLHVESVAWISERKDVLSTFWMLITLHAYERYAILPGTKWYLTVCLTFTLGLLSKSMLVTLPLLLLLVDVWPLERWKFGAPTQASSSRYSRRSFRRLIVEKLPLLALSLVAGVMAIVSSTTAIATNALKTPSILQRLANALHSYGWYVVKTFNPTGLTALYLHPENNLLAIDIAASVFVLLMISIYVAFNGVRRPYLIFGWLWFLISLLPVIGLLQVGLQAHADRYSYIPHIGLLLIIVWEVHLFVNHLPARRSVAATMATTVIVVLAWLTVCQVAVWRTTETLWNQVVAVDPENWMAHSALAGINLQAGRIDEANKDFQIAMKYKPELRASLESMIEIYRRYSGKPEKHSELHNELGYRLVQVNEMEKARVHFVRAVSLSEDNTVARLNLALALVQLGRIQEAKIHLEKLLRQKPDEANAHIVLGDLLERDEQLGAARDHFATALRYNPADEKARKRLEDITKRMEPH